MQIPKTFGECLGDLMRQHQISVARLTQRMNYRSKTSITRMLRDEVRYGSIEDFMQRLEQLDECILSDEEIGLLKNAMEVSRLGRGRYQTYREIWHLMDGGEENMQQPEIECFGSASACTLGELREGWRSARSMEMIIINSGLDSLFSEIGQIFRERPGMDFSVRHYLIMQDDPGSMAAQLGAVMKVIHDVRYQGYYRMSSDGAMMDEHGCGERYHIAVIQGRREDGTDFFQLLFFKQPDAWLLYENEHAQAVMPFFANMVEYICQDVMPLKMQYPRRGLIEGLTAISQRYLSCERDRATCCLAPNICFELIPLEILCGVMFDSALSGCDPDNEPVRTLMEVHRSRYENVHGKKKPTTFIFLWESMVRFARTGRTTDHVAGMRAFNAQERRSILRDVVEKCRTGQYLNVYILRPEVHVREMTLTTHEDLGVYMLDSFTQYDVLNGHSEAFVVMPGFVRVLEQFFRDELIEKYSYSREESLAMLCALEKEIGEEASA